MAHERHFIPAAGHDLLLPFYDPLQKWLGGDSLRAQLIEQAELAPGRRVLDIGCGTGSLAVQIHAAHPQAEVVGLDPDPKALARAARKAERAGATVKLDRGFSDALPYPDASFDRVFSSFMFHHLDAEVKAATLGEVLRVLRPGGSFHLVDFDERSASAPGILGRLFHRDETLRGNAPDTLLERMREAGFSDPQQTGSRRTWFGRVSSYRARRAHGSGS